MRHAHSIDGHPRCPPSDHKASSTCSRDAVSGTRRSSHSTPCSGTLIASTKRGSSEPALSASNQLDGTRFCAMRASAFSTASR
jgi:hypothetical protein